MNVMTKRGSLDNIVTYEHFCDSIEDLKNIPENEITLGSTVIVIDSENNTIIPFIANSKKQWIPLISISGGDSSGDDEEEETGKEDCVYISEEFSYSWNDLNGILQSGKAIILNKSIDNGNGYILYYLSELNQTLSNKYIAIFKTSVDSYIASTYTPGLETEIKYISDSPTELLELMED